ncbi:YdiY family protein [Pseudomaricurvus sp. HS19]|uniref:DUF481 domain-containing protein n=1 Tax=Pseudomaricurvus sp. HS19 TaxID=2692626 RepID=UPI00136B8F51|nr:DUF481 domain-containing protein [Pseudomaricurvus sp. HS19]MYM64724.1 DUF481 domain-containing protein [Pseudomaricurvus sp. HS19]
MIRVVAAAALSVAVAQAAYSGELVLANGDRIEGELVSMDNGTITWKSPSFGEVTVPKEKVVNMTTGTQFKVLGNKEPCDLLGMSDNRLNYKCGDGPVEAGDLLALHDMVAFTDYAADSGYVYKGKLSVAASFERGNTVEDDIDAAAGISFRKQDIRHRLDMSYSGESSDEAPLDEEYDVRYRFDYFFDEFWYWYNQARWEASEPDNISDRYTLGTGLGVQLWENARSAFALESGVDYIKEYLDGTEADRLDPLWNAKDEHMGWRLASDFRHKLPYKIELFNVNEFLQSLEDQDDWEVSADLGVTMPLGPGLFTEWKYEYDYDNQPAIGAGREDRKFTIGVNYQW